MKSRYNNNITFISPKKCTGTAIQNCLLDLWSLFQIVNPHILGDTKQTFKDYYMTPVLRMRKVKAVARVTRKGKERLFELQQKVRAFLLRRTKKEKLAEILPKKQEIIMYCKLTPLQAKIYRAALTSPDFELFTRRHEKCDCGRDMERHECCYSTGDQDTVLWYSNHMLNRDPPGACDQCPYVLHIAFLCLSLSYTHTHTKSDTAWDFHSRKSYGKYVNILIF